MGNKAKPSRSITADTALVVVRRQWNNWQRASYRLADLDGIHWDSISGGVRAPAPQAFLHAYVRCDGMLDGELAHSGAHGPCPHPIKVCVVKADNEPAVIRWLVQRAGPKPAVNVFRVEDHARDIVGALLKGSKHSCVVRKDDLVVVNPRKLPGLSEAGVQTVAGRSKRLKARVKALMEGAADFDRAPYGQMLAYRRRVIREAD